MRPLEVGAERLGVALGHPEPVHHDHVATLAAAGDAGLESVTMTPPLVGEDRLLTLPDGRTVGCWEGGDPAGSPVLFHSGTPSGRLQATLGHEAARARRRTAAVVQPARLRRGPPHLPPGLAQVGRDGLDVLDQYDVDRCAVLGRLRRRPLRAGHGAGRPGQGHGHRRRGRRRAVDADRRPGPRRLGATPRWSAPRPETWPAHEAGFAARAAEEFAWLSPGLSDEEVIDGFFGDVPARRSRWLDETARLRWAADTRDALDHYDGYVRDNLSWGTTWDLDLGRLRVPCHLWYGAEDGMVPPSHGVWLRDRLPDARLEIRPGEGHGAVIFRGSRRSSRTLTS